MLTLSARFLESRPLPANEPYPPSTLITVLAGSETLQLVAPQALSAALESVAEFEPIVLELRYRRVDLSAVTAGATKGKAYRLSVERLVQDGEPD